MFLDIAHKMYLYNFFAYIFGIPYSTFLGLFTIITYTLSSLIFLCTYLVLSIYSKCHTSQRLLACLLLSLPFLA